MEDPKRPGPAPPVGEDEFPDEEAEAGARRELEAMLCGLSMPKDPEPGSVVKGVVVQVGEEEVYLDVGGKSEAVIAREELSDADGNLEVKPGDLLEASVVSTRDGIRLSRRLLRSAKLRAGLDDAFLSGVPVEGRVEAVRKGGFDVAVGGGVRAFCPLSQIDDRRVEEPQAWVGRTLEFQVIELGDKGRNVVLSRRRLLDRESAKKAQEARGRVVEGAVLAGRVVSLQNYGAFVDLGGVQGLLHVSEISHARLTHPSQVLKPGDEVKVKVLKVDPATGKISLGMKQLLDDPWATVAERLRVGQRLDGRVTRVAEFGAFVELLPGIEGLVHVSELAPGKKSADARKLVEEGAALRVQVIEIDATRRRVSLARVDEGAPEEPPTLEPGSTVRGKVERVEPFGVFLRLAPGVSGLIPNEEMGTPRGAEHGKDFPPGTEVEAEVIAVEEGGRRLRLSRARAQGRTEREEMAQLRSRDGEHAPGGSGFSTLGDAFRVGRERKKGA